MPASGTNSWKVLLPDERERTWFKQRLCHKLKHPEVPGPAVVMVARGKYGVGRDSFYALLEAMFGEQYISKPSFDMVTNQGSQGQFNDWLADSIWALVDETLSTDSNRYQRRHEAFEALKRNFEPARKRRDIKRKYMAPETMLCGPGGIFATNDPQPLAIADEDRRFTFLTNGEVQQPSFYVDLHAWMSVPGNVGAFRRDLEAVDLKGFNAYGSLSTRLKDMIIADSKSELDEAVAAAVERALPGKAFSIRQVCEAVQAMAQRDLVGERALPHNWQLIVRSIVGREYHAVGIPPKGRNWQPEFEGRRTRTFALTDKAAKQCTEATALLASGAAQNKPEGDHRSGGGERQAAGPPAGRTGGRGRVAGAHPEIRFRGTLYLIMGCRLYLALGGRVSPIRGCGSLAGYRGYSYAPDYIAGYMLKFLFLLPDFYNCSCVVVISYRPIRRV